MAEGDAFIPLLAAEKELSKPHVVRPKRSQVSSQSCGGYLTQR
jgi:hypothetical protein